MKPTSIARSTIEQWRMVQAVAEYGGFMQAAEKIHKSQSSIHHAVSKIEQQLGVKFFYTEGRRTHLTESGERLLHRIHYLLRETERFEQFASNLQQGIESTLSIAVDGAFPKDRFYYALNQVAEAYPYVHLNVIETILTGANELLDKSQAQIALSPFPRHPFYSEEIAQVQFIAVCGSQHPLAQKTQVTQEDLKTNRQIVLRDSGSQEKSNVGWLHSEQRWTVSHISTSLELISNQQGFAWLPEPHIRPYLQDGRLVPLALPKGIATRSHAFYLNRIDNDTLGPVAQAFLSHIRC